MDNWVARLETITDERGRGATAAEIAEAERVLGVVFPSSYRQFLTKFGWASFGSTEIFGIGATLRHQRLVDMTLSERSPEFVAHLPPHLVPVYNDGGGNLLCLDTSRMVDDECPVVFWAHDMGPDQQPDEWSPNFSDWLNEQMDDECEP